MVGVDVALNLISDQGTTEQRNLMFLEPNTPLVHSVLPD